MSSAVVNLDEFGEKLGDILKSGAAEFLMFGDSTFEESVPPDSDMIEDDLRIKQALPKGTRSIEAIALQNEIPENFVTIPRDEKITIRRFVDGSIRTKYMGEVLRNESGAPLILSHIGAIMVGLESHSVKPIIFDSIFGIYLPGPKILSDSTFDQIKSLSGEKRSFGEIQVEQIDEEDTQSTLRSSAGGKIRARMHDLEIKIMNLAPEDGYWTAIDGALRHPKFYILKKAIGVAKSFSHKVIFLGNDYRPPRTISHLSRLRVGQRTPLYRYKLAKENTNDLSRVVFWYLRIRSSPPTMEPMGGIVKVDMPYDSNDTDNIFEKANTLSSSLLNVSNPSVFPRPRWPNYIYPIRIAEEYLSTALMSEEMFVRIGLAIKRKGA